MDKSTTFQRQNLQQPSQMMSEHDQAALAAEMFDLFCSATTMRQILGLHRNICDTIGLRPSPYNDFYLKLKLKIKSWKAQALWKKFDARAAHRVYNKGNACTGTRVLVIGAGPCGLRAAIEAQLLGAKVVVVEKRDRISRNNVIHLWPFVITDLRNLGAKKFFGKFCAGSIDHISIRQLQCILLKVALLLGVEIHEGVSFLNTMEPSDGCGWRAEVSPNDHAVSHYEFDVLIGADGKRNTLEGFKRKEFRGKLAIAITANFINRKTEAEARAEEISGVAFIFNQTFFKELYHTTGIDLENIVYYKDETHYFVMTAKKHSLIDKGVIMQDFADPAELLSPSNVNTEKLLDYAREAAEFSTKYGMPNLEFAVNHYGKPDVAMFDFTSMFAAEASSRVLIRKNYRLLQCLVGDSLLEPFWPTGSGCARGFLSSMDAAYMIRLWANPKNSTLGVLAQRESIYRLLAQTTPENLQRDIGGYTVDPVTRYPNLNKTIVNVWQVKHLIDTDDRAVLEQTDMDTNVLQIIPETPIKRKRRTGDTLPLSTVLLRWVTAQLYKHEFELKEVSDCITNGRALCALINRYRPDLIDYDTIKNYSSIECNELAFDIFEKELCIPRCISAKDSMTLENIDSKIWLNYLEQICEVFRGEIPHIKHPKLDFAELRDKSRDKKPDFSHLLNRVAIRKSKSPLHDIELTSTNNVHRRSLMNDEKIRRQRKYGGNSAVNIIGEEQGLNDATRRAKKRRSQEKSMNIEERQQRLKEIEQNREERISKRKQQRYQQTMNFYKSLQMLQANTLLRESEENSSPFEDYSIYMYRQNAPEFKDRVKEIERKILYPDRERGIQSAYPRNTDEHFSDRIKSMEQRITSRNQSVPDKKPKDLLRAIGKIDSSDWNVREIEKKIQQSKKTEVLGKSKEKVPKWSKEQFVARQSKMSKPPVETENSAEEKFKEFDQTLQKIDKKLKEGTLRDLGERGKNKVASIAGQFVKKDDNSEEKAVPISKSNSKVALVFNKQTASEKCHFCKQTVYLMEKISTENLTLHRSCLKCHHCHTNLRLGAYAFDRDDPDGRFYCTQHFRLPAKAIRPTAKKSSKHKKSEDIQQKSAEVPKLEKARGRTEQVAQFDLLDRGQTPERIEFENADAMSDGDPSVENVIDENEWTDRNFISGSDESESDLSSSDESDYELESFEDADEGSPIAQTLQLATDWIGKQRYSGDSDDSDNDFYDSSEGNLDDDDADSQSHDGEEFKKAREMRRQEVKLLPLPANLPTDTETEIVSKAVNEKNENINSNNNDLETKIIDNNLTDNINTLNKNENSNEDIFEDSKEFLSDIELTLDHKNIENKNLSNDNISSKIVDAVKSNSITVLTNIQPIKKTDIQRIEGNLRMGRQFSSEIDSLNENVFNLNTFLKLNKEVEAFHKENILKNDIMKKLSLKEKWLNDQKSNGNLNHNTKSLINLNNNKSISNADINFGSTNSLKNKKLEDSKSVSCSEKINEAIKDQDNDQFEVEKPKSDAKLEKKEMIGDKIIETTLDNKKTLINETLKKLEEAQSKLNKSKKIDQKLDEIVDVIKHVSIDPRKVISDSDNDNELIKPDLIPLFDSKPIEKLNMNKIESKFNQKSKPENSKDIGQVLYDLENKFSPKSDRRMSSALKAIETRNFSDTRGAIESQMTGPKMSKQSSLDLSRYFPAQKAEKAPARATNKNQKTLKDVDLNKYFTQSPSSQRKDSFSAIPSQSPALLRKSGTEKIVPATFNKTKTSLLTTKGTKSLDLGKLESVGKPSNKTQQTLKLENASGLKPNILHYGVPKKNILNTKTGNQKDLKDEESNNEDLNMYKDQIDGSIDYHNKISIEGSAKNIDIKKPKKNIKIIKKIVQKKNAADSPKLVKKKLKNDQKQPSYEDQIFEEILHDDNENRSPSKEYQHLFESEKSPSEDVSDKIEKILEETGIDLGLPNKESRRKNILSKTNSLDEAEIEKNENKLILSKEEGDKPMGFQSILSKFESFSSIHSGDDCIEKRLRYRQSREINESQLEEIEQMSKESSKHSSSISDELSDLDKTLEYLKSEWKTEATTFLQKKRINFFSKSTDQQSTDIVHDETKELKRNAQIYFDKIDSETKTKKVRSDRKQEHKNSNENNKRKSINEIEGSLKKRASPCRKASLDNNLDNNKNTATVTANLTYSDMEVEDIFNEIVNELNMESLKSLNITDNFGLDNVAASGNLNISEELIANVGNYGNTEVIDCCLKIENCSDNRELLTEVEIISESTKASPKSDLRVNEKKLVTKKSLTPVRSRLRGNKSKSSTEEDSIEQLFNQFTDDMLVNVDFDSDGELIIIPRGIITNKEEIVEELNKLKSEVSEDQISVIATALKSNSESPIGSSSTLPISPSKSSIHRSEEVIEHFKSPSKDKPIDQYSQNTGTKNNLLKNEANDCQFPKRPARRHKSISSSISPDIPNIPIRAKRIAKITKEMPPSIQDLLKENMKQKQEGELYFIPLTNVKPMRFPSRYEEDEEFNQLFIEIEENVNNENNDKSNESKNHETILVEKTTTGDIDGNSAKSEHNCVLINIPEIAQPSEEIGLMKKLIGHSKSSEETDYIQNSKSTEEIVNISDSWEIIDQLEKERLTALHKRDELYANQNKAVSLDFKIQRQISDDSFVSARSKPFSSSFESALSKSMQEEICAAPEPPPRTPKLKKRMMQPSTEKTQDYTHSNTASLHSHSPSRSLSHSIESISNRTSNSKKINSSQSESIDYGTKILLERSKVLHNKKKDFMDEKIVGNNPYMKKMLNQEKKYHLHDSSDDDLEELPLNYKSNKIPATSVRSASRFPISSSGGQNYYHNRYSTNNNYNRYIPTTTTTSSPMSSYNRNLNRFTSSSIPTSSSSSRNFVNYFKRSPSNPRERDVQSDSESSSSVNVELNSATEISTDSEFDHDPVIREAPKIYIDDTHLRSKPTKVQIKQTIINNRQQNNPPPKLQRILNTQATSTALQTALTHQHLDELEFKPLVQVDPSLLNSKNRILQPLKNPRPGDYMLSKTASTEGIAVKKSLELKKHYLLGASDLGFGNKIMKSGSTSSVLDSKLRNFHSNISECQKLLNPASDCSPGMKTFLDRTSKLSDKSNNASGCENNVKIELTVNSESNINNENNELNKKSELVKITDFVNTKNELNKNLEDVLIFKANEKIANVNIPSPILETIDLISPEKPISSPSFKTEITENSLNQTIIEIIDLTSPNKVENKSSNISKNIKQNYPDIITHIEKESKNSEKEILLSNDFLNNDIQETSIQVPTIKWENKTENAENELDDSLTNSSSSSLSLDDIPHYILDSTTSPDTQNGFLNSEPRGPPPRVEVHDTSGTLMQIDSLMIIDGKYIGDPDDLKLMEIPEGMKSSITSTTTTDDTILENDLNKKSSASSPSTSTPSLQAVSLEIKEKNEKLHVDQKELVKSINNIKPNLKFDTKNENKVESLKTLPLIISQEAANNRKIEPPSTLEIYAAAISPNDSDKTPTANDINLMKSVGRAPIFTHTEHQISDSETEQTGQLFTETELSDWTADDAVSENFVDIEFVLNSNKGTIKRNKRGSKKKSSMLSMNSQKPIGEECMVVKNTNPGHGNDIFRKTEGSGILENLAIDEIEFMDTGSEGNSCAEAYAATNAGMLKNLGYIEFIDNSMKTQYDPVPPKKDNDLMISQETFKKGSNSNKEVLGIDYIEQGACILGNSHEVDLKTPVNEVPSFVIGKTVQKAQSSTQRRQSLQQSLTDSTTEIDDDSLVITHGATTTTTEESDALTVVTSPLDSSSPRDNLPNTTPPSTTSSNLQKNRNSNLSSNSSNSKGNISRKTSQDDNTTRRQSASKEELNISTKRKDSDEISYEEYVRKLQQKISQISGARDSLDLKKQNKRKTSRGTDGSSNDLISLQEKCAPPEIEESLISIRLKELPTLTSKLEEITKERTKQKDLIHDLVMDKLHAKKQLNAEKRLNRIRNRNLFNPSTNMMQPPTAPTKIVENTNSFKSVDFKENVPSTSDQSQKIPEDKDNSSKNDITKMFQTITNISNIRSRPLSDNLEQTPIIKQNDVLMSAATEKLRTEARERARLKSNQDLGLSPEEKLQMLRKRYHLDLQDAIESNQKNTSDDLKARQRKMITSKSVNDISTQQQHSHFVNSADDQSKKSSINDFTSDPNLSNKLQTSASTSTVLKLNKRQKDPDRRKSLIQTVSSFFNKTKKDGNAVLSPLSTSPLIEHNEQSSVFSRFRISPKTKDKSKDKEDTNEIQNTTQKQQKYRKHEFSSTPQLYDGISESKNLGEDDEHPPPIPPLPVNYQRSDDENTEIRENQKKQRSLSKASKQGELKRIRIAQEIQREQEEIEVQLKEYEAGGVAIEKKLRGEGQNIENLEAATMGANDEKLLKELLEIWRNITQLKKRDEELGIRQQELQLEHRHAQLKDELNVRLSCSKLDKSSSDVAAEGAILNEMLEIVAKRAALRPTDLIESSSAQYSIDLNPSTSNDASDI